MKITVKINGTEQEVELSNEQIIAIGKEYFSLVNPSPTIELKPLDTEFGVMEQPDDLLHYGDIRTG